MSNQSIPYEAIGRMGGEGLKSCECYSGRTAGYFLDYQSDVGYVPIATMFDAEIPNYVFLMIGTNDTGYDYSLSHVSNDYNDLLDEIEARTPAGTQIVVSTVPWCTDPIRRGRVVSYNEQVVIPILQERMNQSSRYHLVDGYSLINSTADMEEDKVHPNESGLSKINQMWFNKLMELENVTTGKDCAGVEGGSAFIDNCDQCVGGMTGEVACPINILRIGDSNTRGYSGGNYFKDLMLNAGMDYIAQGSQQAWTHLSDYNWSEGFSGKKVAFFTEYQASEGDVPIERMFNDYDPDFIFLMIGTNNMAGSGDNNIPDLYQKYDKLLAEINDRISPSTHVIISTILWANDAFRNSKGVAFNEQVVEPLVQDYIDAGAPFYLVDAYSLINSADEMIDAVHPNTTGQNKVNQMWFDKLVEILNENIKEQGEIDCAGVVNGTAVLDDCGVCVEGSTGLTACVDAIQGEDACTFSGTMDSDNAGYEGSGYFNSDNTLGSYGTWFIESENTELVTLYIRYANKSALNRIAEFKVNGSEAIAQIDFPTTESWVNWETSTVEVELHSGGNELEIIALTTEGLPNIDQFSFFNPEVEEDLCTITSLVKDAQRIEPIQIVPNPVKNHIHLSTNGPWQIFTVDGRLVTRGSGDEVLLLNLTSGIYVLQVGQERKVFLKE